MLRPYEPRIMTGTDMGLWQETVYNTVFRSNNGWLICRSRGKNNGGRITGTRFYIIARDGMGRPHKVRNKGNFIRYFDSAPAAAFAAVEYAIEKRKSWERMKFVSDNEALALQKKQLLLEIAHLNKTKASLQSYVGRLNGSKTQLVRQTTTLSQDIEKAAEPIAMGEGAEEIEAKQQLPVWLHKAVTHVFRQGKPH